MAKTPCKENIIAGGKEGRSLGPKPLTRRKRRLPVTIIMIIIVKIMIIIVQIIIIIVKIIIIVIQIVILIIMVLKVIERPKSAPLSSEGGPLGPAAHSSDDCNNYVSS